MASPTSWKKGSAAASASSSGPSRSSIESPSSTSWSTPSSSASNRRRSSGRASRSAFVRVPRCRSEISAVATVPSSSMRIERRVHPEVSPCGRALIYSAPGSTTGADQMSQLSIRVEPVADPAGRHTAARSERAPVLVGLVAEPVLAETEPPDLIEPIVGFRNWRIFCEGHTPGRLSSPYFPVPWSAPTLRAECHRLRTAEDLLREQHAAPAPGCGCGISAYHAATGEFSKVDYRGVSGIVTVWGRIEVDSDGMRAEHARVEALATYSRWSRA